MADDVVVAVPIILPPQIAIVSIGSPQPELALDESGRVHERAALTVGLSYDHRVVNGRQAVEFLTAFKSGLERPHEVPV
jgi:2-oxoglutarate dehydrogenase E2 component (dihydrolipoamide succinyltransferase)